MLDIIYFDRRFVAVNKPSGLLVHRTSWCPRETACLELLRDQIDSYVYPVHRLDRATSGVVVFALDAEAASALSGLFRTRRVQKSYLAVVRGFVDLKGTFCDPLKREGGKSAHSAITEFHREATVELHAPVGRYQTARYSLVRAIPRTGRHHQIRRHFAHASHPIIGDTKHGDSAHNRFFRDNLAIDRLLLMATDLSFPNPFATSIIRIHAPLPREIDRLFARIGWPIEPPEPSSDMLQLPEPLDRNVISGPPSPGPSLAFTDRRQVAQAPQCNPQTRVPPVLRIRSGT